MSRDASVTAPGVLVEKDELLLRLLIKLVLERAFGYLFFNCINCKLKKKFRGHCDLRSLSPNPETELVEPESFTMLGEFVYKVVVMILGYAYPAFQCFKTLEHSRVNINDLRFWCQYWVIVAILSVCERIGDVLISGFPLYDELKLLFIIYLWSPRTKGTSYVYETLLQPLVSRHETDLDQHLSDLRLRAWDLAIYYRQNYTKLGRGAFVQVIQFLLTQSQRLRSGNIGALCEGMLPSGCQHLEMRDPIH